MLEDNSHLTYRVEIEVKDLCMTAAGLQCFLEHSLADALNHEQIKQKASVEVVKIRRK